MICVWLDPFILFSLSYAEPDNDPIPRASSAAWRDPWAACSPSLSNISMQNAGTPSACWCALRMVPIQASSQMHTRPIPYKSKHHVRDRHEPCSSSLFKSHRNAKTPVARWRAVVLLPIRASSQPRTMISFLLPPQAHARTPSMPPTLRPHGVEMMYSSALNFSAPLKTAMMRALSYLA